MNNEYNYDQYTNKQNPNASNNNNVNNQPILNFGNSINPNNINMNINNNINNNMNNNINNNMNNNINNFNQNAPNNYQQKNMQQPLPNNMINNNQINNNANNKSKKMKINNELINNLIIDIKDIINDFNKIKSIKTDKNDPFVKQIQKYFQILLIIQLILTGFSFAGGDPMFQVIIGLIFAGLLYLGYDYTKNGAKLGGIIGIITGLFMILSFGFISILMGIFLLVYSIKYYKLFNNN